MIATTNTIIIALKALDGGEAEFATTCFASCFAYIVEDVDDLFIHSFNLYSKIFVAVPVQSAVVV